MIGYFNGTSKDASLVSAVEAWEQLNPWADHKLFEVHYFDQGTPPPVQFDYADDCACVPCWRVLPDGRAIVGVEIIRHPGSKPIQQAMQKSRNAASLVDMIKHAQEAGNIKRAVERGEYGNETLRFILYAQRPFA